MNDFLPHKHADHLEAKLISSTKNTNHHYWQNAALPTSEARVIIGISYHELAGTGKGNIQSNSSHNKN